MQTVNFKDVAFDHDKVVTKDPLDDNTNEELQEAMLEFKTVVC